MDRLDAGDLLARARSVRAEEPACPRALLYRPNRAARYYRLDANRNRPHVVLSAAAAGDSSGAGACHLAAKRAAYGVHRNVADPVPGRAEHEVHLPPGRTIHVRKE